MYTRLQHSDYMQLTTIKVVDIDTSFVATAIQTLASYPGPSHSERKGLVSDNDYSSPFNVQQGHRNPSRERL